MISDRDWMLIRINMGYVHNHSVFVWVEALCPSQQIFSHDVWSFSWVEPVLNQRTNGPVNAHLISCPSKAQNIQNLENIW